MVPVFQVPERSRFFLQGAIDSCLRLHSPINVMLLVGNSRYDMGTFDITEYEHPVMRLVRRHAITKPTPSPPPPTVTTPAAPTTMPVESRLESQYRQLLLAWGVDASYARMMYHLPCENNTSVWYTPDGMLFNVLSLAALEWCGDQNRFGSHCILEIKPV